MTVIVKQESNKEKNINRKKKGARKFGILHLQQEVTNTMKPNEYATRKGNKQKGIVL